jgi:hypothetical protein
MHRTLKQTKEPAMISLKRYSLAALIALAVAAPAAYAIGDITLVNQSQNVVSPYVKTNCWNQDVIAEGPDKWVFFGGVLPGTQFTWDNFHLILDPKCKNPIVKFTLVVYGAEAPVANDPSLTQLMHYDATENYRIVVGSKIVITERPE